MYQRRWIALSCAILVLAVAIALACTPGSPLRPPEDVEVSTVESAALAQLGKPYVFGEAGPDSFDCSGLMTFAYAEIGVELFHNTRVVAADERYETIDDPAALKPGDLVFFNTVEGPEIDHVGLWLGRKKFVHASSSAGEVVVARFDEVWRERFVVAKRVIRRAAPA